jgi:hypothetical protein
MAYGPHLGLALLAAFSVMMLPSCSSDDGPEDAVTEGGERASQQSELEDVVSTATDRSVSSDTSNHDVSGQEDGDLLARRPEPDVAQSTKPDDVPLGNDATDEISDTVQGDEDSLLTASDISEPLEPDAQSDTDINSAMDATGSDATVKKKEPWRSELYPEDWTPAHTMPDGRFLHDFSYAGYHHGEVEIGVNMPSYTADVVTEFGADSSGQSDTTAALQGAIDAASTAGGGIVFFPAGLYRIDGQLTIEASNIVLRGEGNEVSQLHFTQHEAMSYQAHLSFVGTLSHDVELSIVSLASTRYYHVEVDDASSLSVGDDIEIGWVITDAFIASHGMTGVWQAFNDTWQPFFYREIAAIDMSQSPHLITVDVPFRYSISPDHQPTLRRLSGYLEECGVEDLAFANAVGWDAAWEQNQVHVLAMDGVKDSWIRRIRSFPSPSAPTEGDGAGAHLQASGLRIRHAKRVSVLDSHLAFSQHRGGGGNGYLFEVRQSNEILFADSSGRAGRHNFIQNWGFGVNGCVWLRLHSHEGKAITSKDFPFAQTGYSEFHHSLATANLIDDSILEDGWSAVNRGDWSTGAGHSATENVIWNSTGGGVIRSRQFGWGYVVGTSDDMFVQTSLGSADAAGTAPEDWTEGIGDGAFLLPASLYEDQLTRRLAAEDSP